MDDLLTIWEHEIDDLKLKCTTLEKTIHEKDQEIKRLKIKHIENEVELGKFRQDLKVLKIKKSKDPTSRGNSKKRDSRSWDRSQ